MYCRGSFILLQESSSKVGALSLSLLLSESNHSLASPHHRLIQVSLNVIVEKMQPVWLCNLSGRRLDETYEEKTQWRKIKQMQPESNHSLASPAYTSLFECHGGYFSFEWKISKFVAQAEWFATAGWERNISVKKNMNCSCIWATSVYTYMAFLKTVSKTNILIDANESLLKYLWIFTKIHMNLQFFQKIISLVGCQHVNRNTQILNRPNQAYLLEMAQSQKLL